RGGDLALRGDHLRGHERPPRPVAGRLPRRAPPPPGREAAGEGLPQGGARVRTAPQAGGAGAGAVQAEQPPPTLERSPGGGGASLTSLFRSPLTSCAECFPSHASTGANVGSPSDFPSRNAVA